MGINDETIGRPVDRPQFDTTHWSLVLAAQNENSDAARIALAALCEKYWYPLYAFVRQTESDANQACDIIQGFFEKVIEKNYISDADPKRGKFRTFLLTSLTNFMANQHDKATAVKRGGGAPHFSFEFHKGEQRFLQEPADTQTPDKRYQRRWAVTLLNQVLEGIRAEFVAEGKGAWFEHLAQFLTPAIPIPFNKWQRGWRRPKVQRRLPYIACERDIANAFALKSRKRWLIRER